MKKERGVAGREALVHHAHKRVTLGVLVRVGRQCSGHEKIGKRNC